MEQRRNLKTYKYRDLLTYMQAVQADQEGWGTTLFLPRMAGKCAKCQARVSLPIIIITITVIIWSQKRNQCNYHLLRAPFPSPSDSDHFLTAHLTLRPRLMPWLATPLSLETSNLRRTVTEHRPKCPIWDSFFATGLTLKLIAPRDSFHCCLKATTICSRIMASCTQKWTEIITSNAQIQISVPLFQSHDDL